MHHNLHTADHYAGGFELEMMGIGKPKPLLAKPLFNAVPAWGWCVKNLIE
ncbi:hypothetical protein PDE_02442 [Penicillium oxalicum 114-2]|uniref:Uncharacterized protein n=1 Tax=Penicillium oxalicum (strain 114-2 / CGMCC 5302) TaxID=933388 RepID=S7ZB78_PENO1|nr:hypothetical protein PDE_02442 [Penicillium oxalicum 114-2]